jgi:hypothetical protein
MHMSLTVISSSMVKVPLRYSAMAAARLPCWVAGWFFGWFFMTASDAFILSNCAAFAAIALLLCSKVFCCASIASCGMG